MRKYSASKENEIAIYCRMYTNDVKNRKGNDINAATATHVTGESFLYTKKMGTNVIKYEMTKYICG
jgi:hypothetical protein